MFHLDLMFVILALGLSEANAPYPIFCSFFNKSLNVCVVLVICWLRLESY